MTPLVQAEQAVLGALFLDPRQLIGLSGWLRPEHFDRPVHAALYAAMLKLRAEGHLAATAGADGPVPLAWITDTVQEASGHTRGLTAVFPHLLVSACPRPEHAPIYGRMVLEGAIHRSVALHAGRLHQAALADLRRGSVDETVHHAQVLSDVLVELARVWGTEPRPVAPPDAYSLHPGRPHSVADQVLADEEFLLGCLSSHSEQLLDLVHWLRPDDFIDPGHQQIYRALRALLHRGEPIDQLTVLWEAQRRGALSDGTLDTDRVQRVCDPLVSGAAEHFGEQIVNASLVRTAATAARQVGALADHEALAPGQLLDYALYALGPLEDVRRRLRIAQGIEPGPSHADDRPGGPPPSSRTDAALARSHVADGSPVLAPTPSRAAPPARHNRRSPS
ncbi:DnaB-like helicase N-terminal domain-containing protein [Streptomyces sp. NPDC050264]|uniref:DnaB-like helicase N-terminal domain-containing protein n=1 Tax=Streptomyces sp. NPDC050264 TaxID=3155038 RepID=UPI003440BB84